MAASTGPRSPREQSIKSFAFLLATGSKAWMGTRACGEKGTGLVKPAAAGDATQLSLGEFSESIDNTAGAAPVPILVNLDKEIWVRFYDNAAGGAALVAADLFNDCWWLDDHTVTNSATGNSLAGRVWIVDPINGVAVEAYTL